MLQDWFFRDNANSLRHRDAIRAYFTPFDRYLQRSRAVVEAARRGDALVVGVHIRRGDYAIFRNGRHLYDHAQYRALMERTAALYADRGVSFLVCSDEPVPRDAFAGLDVTTGEGHELVDLYTLAGCDRLLGPVSTYSVWASYYGDVPLWAFPDADAIPQDADFVPRRELALGVSARS
jgi:hypothetical protein